MKEPSQASLRKRKEQNKVAQRKFRERRAKIAQEQKEEFERISAQCRLLLEENEVLKSHSKASIPDIIIMETPNLQHSPEPESVFDIFPLEETIELSEDLNKYTTEILDLDANNPLSLSFEGMQTIDDTRATTPNVEVHISSESPILIPTDNCDTSEQSISRSECSLKESLPPHESLFTEEESFNNYMQSISDNNNWGFVSSLPECGKGTIDNESTKWPVDYGNDSWNQAAGLDSCLTNASVTSIPKLDLFQALLQIAYVQERISHMELEKLKYQIWLSAGYILPDSHS